MTVLDKSLEPKLGERLKTRHAIFDYYGKQNHKLGGYRAPKLYLGGAPLIFNSGQDGDLIWTDDLSKVGSGRPRMGILGMDCLHRYCLQLDFQSNKLRLLDPSVENTEDWGSAVPLVLPFFPLLHGTLLGKTNEFSHIDTGDPRDGAMTRNLFRQSLKERHMADTNTFEARGGGSPYTSSP